MRKGDGKRRRRNPRYQPRGKLTFDQHAPEIRTSKQDITVSRTSKFYVKHLVIFQKPKRKGRKHCANVSPNRTRQTMPTRRDSSDFCSQFREGRRIQLDREPLKSSSVQCLEAACIRSASKIQQGQRSPEIFHSHPFQCSELCIPHACLVIGDP